MEQKTSFVLRMNYADIVEEMSDKQAGALIKAIFKYVATGKESAGLNDVELRMAFKFIKQDIDHDGKKYIAQCRLNQANGKLGGAPKGNRNAKTTERLTNNRVVLKQPGGLKTTLDDVVVDVVVDGDSDVDKLLTADKSAGEPKPKRKLNNLQQFSNAVIAEFEDLETDEQIGVWFRRNCRCLTDILEFCGGDISLGVGTIRACLEYLKENKLEGGYAAVCRNLPKYYDTAKNRLCVGLEQGRSDYETKI